MFSEKNITSGVESLDQLMGGLYIGDNVVWYDTAGSLASVFCLNFIRASQSEHKPMIYVSFDRSPKNILEKLGKLAQSPSFVLLDCFTFGKGAGSDIFLKFYEKPDTKPPCRIIRVDQPSDPHKVAQALYDTHKTMNGDVRFVVESLTGIQSLWNGEDDLLRFYSRTCPRLYELNTVAYWIMEKHAHSQRLRAHINTVAQVAIELSVKRGKTFLSILKAEKRDPGTLNRPYEYRSKESEIYFESEKGGSVRVDLGARLKELRSKRGLSQTELSRMIGVTPSSISQIESNLIYPSVPALLKIAEMLNVDISSFFNPAEYRSDRTVFKESDYSDIQFHDFPKDNIFAKRLLPPDLDAKAEPYLIEIPAGKALSSHFFSHKGEEIGYILSGELKMKLEKIVHTVKAGDTIYLSRDNPSRWKNEGSEPAKILWIKVR